MQFVTHTHTLNQRYMSRIVVLMAVAVWSGCCHHVGCSREAQPGLQTPWSQQELWTSGNPIPSQSVQQHPRCPCSFPSHGCRPGHICVLRTQKQARAPPSQAQLQLSQQWLQTRASCSTKQTESR